MIVDTCRIGCIERCIIEANLNFVWQHTSNFKTKNIMNFFLVLDCNWLSFFCLWNAIAICTWSGRSLFKYRSRFWGIIWYAIILIQLMQCNNADAVVTIAVTFGFFFSGCHYFFLRRVRASNRVFYNSITIDYVKKITWIHIYTS